MFTDPLLSDGFIRHDIDGFSWKQTRREQKNNKEWCKCKSNELTLAPSAGPMEKEPYFLRLKTEIGSVSERSSVEETQTGG
jgi:hypothetical protein